MEFLYDIIGETIILGIDSLIFGFCVKELTKCKHILNALESAPVLNLGASLYKEIHKYPNHVIPYVVIRGVVKPLGSPIISNHSNSVTGVIQRLTIKEHVTARTSAGFWSNQTSTIHEVYNSTPFVLNNGKYNIEVVDALSAEVLDLDVISNKFEPMSLGVMDHIMSMFSGVRQRGLQTMEEMLRDGSFITAVGEISNSSSGLKIQPPRDGLPLYLTTATKSSLLQRAASSRDCYRVALVLLGMMAAVVSSRILYKFLKKRRKLLAEEELKKQLEAGRRERRVNARTHDDGDLPLCIVCAENPKEIILLPCGHVCLCEECSSHIEDKCPICRGQIKSRAPAFIS